MKASYNLRDQKHNFALEYVFKCPPSSSGDEKLSAKDKEWNRVEKTKLHCFGFA
jgi:hypothetical protein